MTIQPTTALALASMLLITPLMSGHSQAASLNDTAHAQDRNWQLGVSLGYGNRTNPLIESDDLTLVAVVDLSWYGERFFFDNGDLGFTFIDNHRFTLNAVARVNTERLFFENANSLLVSFTNASGASGGPVQDGVDVDGTDGNDDTTDDGTSQQPNQSFSIPDRDYALEAGLEWLTDGRWGFAQASLLQDISDKHQGFEANLALGRSGHWRRFTWTVSAGVSYRSGQLNDYYYGILPQEAQGDFAAYEAEGGINLHASALLRYYVSKSVSLGLVVEYETLSDAIADSPFVTEDHITTAYAGVKYTF